MVEGRTYRPIIRSEKCQTCKVCIRGCPAEFIPEYREEEESRPEAPDWKRGEGKVYPPRTPESAAQGAEVKSGN